MLQKTDRAILMAGAALSVTIACTSHAKAYIDPSVTTFAIQAVVGVVVAAGAVFAIWFRNAKHKVAKKLGIDENKNKTTEEEIKEYDDDDDE